MSEANTPNTDEAMPAPQTTAAYSAGVGPVRRKPDISARITAEEIRLLIDLGQSSNYTIIAGIFICGAAFWTNAPIWSTGVVLAIQIIAQLHFNHVRAGFRADPNIVSRATYWAKRYAFGTFLSGLTWGVGGVLWLQNASFAQQAFYALVLACISVATVVTRATYPPAAFTYIATAVAPTVVMYLMTPDIVHLATVGLAIMFLLTLVGWTRRIARAYREAIRLRFENADLVERMARAHAATEQKRCEAEAAEQRAQAANRLKSEFLDILGQEVSSPLDTLAAMARQLSDEPLSEVQRNLASAMSLSSERLQRLFSDMIDFSQMEAQTLELKPQHFDPVELVRSVVREMRPQAAERGLSLELDVVPGSLATMLADAARLRQVLTNLISNAIKFTESGGVILRVQMVEQTDGKPGFRFSVIDTGVGLTSEARAHLFEGFAKGRNSNDDDAQRASASTGGMGLGLAVSDRLVRLMGGQIEVDSAIDQGSTFWFLLPREMPMRRQATPAKTHGAEAQAAAFPQDRLVDHDFLYEMERTLGPDDGADRMVEALTRILSLYDAIERARVADDADAMKESALLVHKAARSTGLVALAESARLLAEADSSARADEMARLQQCMVDTWSQLARSYPGLSINEPDF